LKEKGGKGKRKYDLLREDCATGRKKKGMGGRDSTELNSRYGLSLWAT